MKKGIAIALAASFVLSIGSTALAFPVNFNGDVRFQFRDFKDSVGQDRDEITGEHARIRLNFNGAVDQNVTLFGRLSARNYFGDAADTKGAIDQFGVNIKANDWNYKLGRQGVTLGQGSIISTGYDAVGGDNKFDGVVASGKLGEADVNVIAGKTNTAFDGVAASWLGFDVSGKLSDNFNVGAAFAGEKSIDSAKAAPAKNYWAVNASFNPTSALALNGEFVTSNTSGANANNTGYFLGGTYSWDKDSFGIQYNNVGVNSVDGANSGIGGDLYPIKGAGIPYNVLNQNNANGNTKYSGFTYTYTHKMSQAATLSVMYMDLKADVDAGHDKELAAGVKWNF